MDPALEGGGGGVAPAPADDAGVSGAPEDSGAGVPWAPLGSGWSEPCSCGAGSSGGGFWSLMSCPPVAGTAAVSRPSGYGHRGRSVTPPHDDSHHKPSGLPPCAGANMACIAAIRAWRRPGPDPATTGEAPGERASGTQREPLARTGTARAGSQYAQVASHVARPPTAEVRPPRGDRHAQGPSTPRGPAPAGTARHTWAVTPQGSPTREGVTRAEGAGTPQGSPAAAFRPPKGAALGERHPLRGASPTPRGRHRQVPAPTRAISCSRSWRRTPRRRSTTQRGASSSRR